MSPITIKTINCFIAIIIATLLTMVTVTAYLYNSTDNTMISKPSSFIINNFKFVSGAGITSNNSFKVVSAINGIAVISSGHINLIATEYSILKYTLDTNNTKQPTFFAMSANNPRSIIQIALPENNTGIINLKEIATWSGAITEIGFFCKNKQTDDTCNLINFSLEQTTIINKWHLLINQWLQFEKFGQHSINFALGGAKHQQPPLLIVIYLWIALGIIALWLCNKISLQKWNWYGVIIIISCGWLILDAHWLTNAITQLKLSQQTYAGLSENAKQTKGLDAEIFIAMQKLKQDFLPEKPAKIILIFNKNTQHYYALRARYHLIPHNVYETNNLPNKHQLASGQYILVIGQVKQLSYSNYRESLTWDNTPIIAATLIHKGNYGQLFQLK